ncbi:ATP-binding protein [Thalassorhabdus alkalitolerans]|uniref:histidine kinase n=1 Tax=Thalassorhabdus alkalitolerans TaxID=2282697 RepID=A0ABW0YQG8_9BACI
MIKIQYIIDDLQTFLLNIFFVFTFFFIYQKFIEDKTSVSVNKLLLVIISGLSIILCMTFTVNFSDTGHIFDLRQVPFILGALYGGRKVAVSLFIILIAYRLSMEGQGVYGALLVNIMILGLLLYIIPRYKNAPSIKKKVTLSLTVSSAGILTMLLVTFLIYPEIVSGRYISFIILFLIVQTAAIFSFINFIEKGRKDKALEKELRKLEKLKTVSEIAASISHEVRNPLTVTKGFIQLLRDSDITEDTKQYYITFALEELNRAERTISDYLTFAKPTIEDVTILNINKEIQYILKVVSPFASMNNVKIEVKKTGEVHVAGEGEKFHQCLINVIKNGIESMPEGGKITISIRREEQIGVIQVEDTGSGMNDEQIERLGTPFYTTKDKGTGLGTMVVYSIIKAMNGEIKVKSEVNKGTSFTIYLPIVEVPS